MPTQLTPDGLELATQAEIQAQYEGSMRAIYGADVNLGPQTPDGQMLNIFVQSVLDLQDLLLQIYNGFDPDQAVGRVLDQRVAINGIQRQAGTHTVTPVSLVLSQSVNLFGLDQDDEDPYTIADQAGNRYVLQATMLAAGPGTVSLDFQAELPGAVTPIPNTITVPVTIVLGVDSVNNPLPFTTLGVNEETDGELRLRRQRSVTLPSQGFFDSLIANLLDVPGVTYAAIHENDSDSTDSVGVPSHTIWVIVGGSGSSSAIAGAIYVERTAGCGMFSSGGSGARSFPVTQADGSVFVVRWDQVEEEVMYARFTLTPLDGSTPVNYAAILEQLPTLLRPGPNQQVNVNELATLVQDIDPNALVTSPGFSLAPTGPFTNTLTPSTPNLQFVLGSDSVIALPILLTPTAAEVEALATQQLTPLGGYGPYTYAITVNNSGGSVGSLTGLYTAGSTTGVTDTVEVTDALSNTATALMSVV